MEELHISTVTLGVIGSGIGILLAMIAFFLSRLLKQFDDLQESFRTLISTVARIDKDLSSDVGILKARISEYDPIWERMRAAELDIAGIKVGGCEQLKRCLPQ